MTVVARSRVAEGVELVELDDPGRYNALTVAMVAELRDTFAELRTDRDVPPWSSAVAARASAPAPT